MNPNITMWFNSQGLIDSWNTTLENLPDEVSSSIDDVQAYCWGIIWKKNCVYINDKQLYIVLPEEVNHNPDKNGKLLFPVDNFKITIPDKIRNIIKTSSDWKDEYIQYNTVTEYVNKTEEEWQWEQLFEYDGFLKKHLKSQESRNATIWEWLNPLLGEAFIRSTYTFPGYHTIGIKSFSHYGKSVCNWLANPGFFNDWFKANYMSNNKNWDHSKWNYFNWWCNINLPYYNELSHYYGFTVRWVKDSNFIFDKK